MKKMVLSAWCMVFGALAANAAEIAVDVDERQTFAYTIDGGELVLTETVGPARVTFAANRNATYSFYGVSENGAATRIGEPLVVTDASGETVSESGEEKVAVDARATKEIDGSSGAMTFDLTYSGDGWGESVGGSAAITVAFEGGTEQSFATGLTGVGTVAWNPKISGTYVFKHTVGGVAETATFKVVKIPGGVDNPWEVGASDAAAVTAYVKDGYLYLTGEGEVTEFADSAPWEVYEQLGSPLAGAVLPRTVTLPASVLATLPISVKGGEPSGAISSAEFERIEVVDGKAYLGVSVATNDVLEVENVGEGWGKAKIEAVELDEATGEAILTVPATAEKGFMILKSKSAK